MRNFLMFVMVVAIAVLVAVAVKQREDIEKMRQMWKLQLVIDDAVIGHLSHADTVEVTHKPKPSYKAVEL